MGAESTRSAELEPWRPWSGVWLGRCLVVASPRGMGPTRADSAELSLRRSIGTFALAASIINVTIGAGIFRLPADMAAALGPTAPVAYLLRALAMGPIAILYEAAGGRG